MAADGKHLLFVSRPSGYELLERDGEPPQAGAEVELDGVRLTVVKLASSPLPQDPRPCAFLQS
ncbi:MAG TPA: hypothetical protein VG479_11540 [Gaiellaceae bacterium]|jgi:hypothetical protein|nr:hypothetical protein [Gaiellaceae bacterium]